MNRFFALSCALVLLLKSGFAQSGHLPKPPQLPVHKATLLQTFPIVGATGMAFVPGKSQLVLVADTLQFWDYRSGKRLKNVVVQEFPVLQNLQVGRRGEFVTVLCFSDPDRDLGGSALAFWNLKAQKWGRIQKAPPGTDTDFAAFALSPDGKTLATSQLSTATHDFRAEKQKSGRVRLWNAKNGRLLKTLARGRFYNLEWSPDGKFLVGAGERDAVLWNWRSGKQTRLQNAGAWALSFSPDGKHLATIGRDSADFGGAVRLFETVSGRLIKNLPLPWSDMGDVLFSRDGKTLWVGGGAGENHDTKGRTLDMARGEVLFVSVKDLKVQARFLTEGGEVSNLALSDDGKTLATVQYGDNKSGGVKTWRLP